MADDNLAGGEELHQSGSNQPISNTNHRMIQEEEDEDDEENIDFDEEFSLSENGEDFGLEIDEGFGFEEMKKGISRLKEAYLAFMHENEGNRFGNGNGKEVNQIESMFYIC